MSLAVSGGRNLSELNESEIQDQIIEVLERRNIFFYRAASGGNRKARFGRRGAPDLILVIKGLYVGVEVKTLKGEQSREQTVFQTDLEKKGHGIYLLVRSAMELDQELIRRFL
jgi:SpoU rRNA methylase family enzyme